MTGPLLRAFRSQDGRGQMEFPVLCILICWICDSSIGGTYSTPSLIANALHVTPFITPPPPKILPKHEMNNLYNAATQKCSLHLERIKTIADVSQLLGSFLTAWISTFPRSPFSWAGTPNCLYYSPLRKSFKRVSLEITTDPHLTYLGMLGVVVSQQLKSQRLWKLQ